MTNERLLKLAEKLGIPVLEKYPEADPPYIVTELQDLPIYSWIGEDGQWHSFIWSIDGPDLGNVAAVVWKRLEGKWIIELRNNPIMGITFCKLVSMKDNSKYDAWNDDPSVALIEAAGKALGVE
jgi:hypothetical protein